jgi:hypothetical protein
MYPNKEISAMKEMRKKCIAPEYPNKLKWLHLEFRPKRPKSYSFKANPRIATKERSQSAPGRIKSSLYGNKNGNKKRRNKKRHGQRNGNTLLAKITNPKSLASFFLNLSKNGTPKTAMQATDYFSYFVQSFEGHNNKNDGHRTNFWKIQTPSSPFEKKNHNIKYRKPSYGNPSE